MHITKKKLSELNPARYNPRKDLTPDDPEYQHIKTSIETFGYIDPIIVNARNGVIVGGHQRYKILLDLGYTEIECVEVDMDEQEEMACNAALNKAQGLWDEEKLADLLAQINDFDMSAFGFEDINLLDEDGEVQEDNYDPEEELAKEPKAKLGDIYQLGNHRLMCGDSTDSADVEELMGGNLAKLVVEDPPYNVNYEGAAGKIANDHMDGDSFYQFLLDAFKNAYNFSEKGGAIYVWHADGEGRNFRQAFIDAGYDLKQCLVWVKNGFVMGRQDYQWRHEPCLYGWKPGAAHYFTEERTHDTVIDDNEKPNLKAMKKDELLAYAESLIEQLEDTPQSVIYCDKPQKSAEHPTMKPLKLIAKLVQNSSKAGWNVLDLFGGSGSTLMVCEALDRNCFMMEYDPKFVDVIIDRWEKATGKEARLIHRRV